MSSVSGAEMLADVAVIGASFAGMSAALQLARGRRSVLLIDGGHPRNEGAPEVHGFFSRDGQHPAEVLREGREQLLRYPSAKIVQPDVVVTVSGAIDNFVLETERGLRIRARRLILASGIRDDLPDIPGLKELWGRGVYHCPYCHGYEVQSKPMTILVTNPMTADVAVLLREWSADVTALLNGADLSNVLPEATMKRLERHVKLERGRITTVERDGDGHITGVRLEDGRLVPCGALYVKPHGTASAIVTQLGVKLDAMGLVEVKKPFQETSVPGVYAAGDHTTMFTLVTTAVCDGTFAGAFVHRSLNMADFA